MDGFSDNTASLIKAGQWLSINGVVYQTAAAVTPVVNEGDVTLTYGLKEAVANDDAIIFYASANLINLAAGYDAGHLDYINVDDGAGAAPDEIQVGQILTINGANYSVMETVAAAGGTVDVLLDRALASAVVDNTPVLYGPHGGGFNLGFHRNALTLALRPLAPPLNGTGTLSYVTAMAGVPMRVVITYDGEKQGHRVTLDFLAGVKVLDTDLGAVALT